MKRLLLAGLLLVLLAGGYYVLGLFFAARNLDVYRYTLQSHNLDELKRFAPVVEAQMRGLPFLQDVGSNLQISSEAIGNSRLMLPGITISFKLAPGVALGDAIDRIQRMEKELPLPATITTSFSKRSGPREVGKPCGGVGLTSPSLRKPVAGHRIERVEKITARLLQPGPLGFDRRRNVCAI
jgi:hypothetical protein